MFESHLVEISIFQGVYLQLFWFEVNAFYKI